jgi:hypothetical protein
MAGLRLLCFGGVLALAPPALAQTQDESPSPAPELGEEVAPMSAWDALERMPPRASYEVGLVMSFGTIAYFADETPPWVGFGIYTGGGRVFSNQHRLGAGLGVQLEGPVPLYYSASVEPQATWDYIAGKKLQIGASVGPALMLHSELETIGSKNNFTVNPMAAFRIGYSEGWSRVGRRFFALLVPKFRWIDDRPDLSLGLIIGSGNGR